MAGKKTPRKLASKKTPRKLFFSIFGGGLISGGFFTGHLDWGVFLPATLSTKPSFVFRFFFVFQDKTEIFFFVLLPAKLLVFASSLLPFAQYQNSNAEGDYNEQEPKSASLSP